MDAPSWPNPSDAPCVPGYRSKIRGQPHGRPAACGCIPCRRTPRPLFCACALLAALLELCSCGHCLTTNVLQLHYHSPAPAVAVLQPLFHGCNCHVPALGTSAPTILLPRSPLSNTGSGRRCRQGHRHLPWMQWALWPLSVVTKAVAICCGHGRCCPL